MIIMIDFNKLNGNESIDTLLHPRDLFEVLPGKNDKYDGYLRDVQTEVLAKWFDLYRDNTDVVIKMNTGSGKTVVGLLMLKSCLNENKGPAVYVAPDPYLAQQIFSEANDLGIPVTDNPEDIFFKKGESILIVNIYKIINGKSVFGVGESKISIGSIVIDDAHACIDTTEKQFTVNIPKNSYLYFDILSLFRNSLKNQSEIALLELEDGEPYKNLLVPFWSWNENKSHLLKLLHKASKVETKEMQSVKFGWPLIKNNLALCDCVIGSDSIEISPKQLPINILPSFDKAERRIFMSATLSDDSVLVSHFNINSESIPEAITPNSSNDIGERMILVPQELNPKITDNELKGFYKYLSKEENVVIIVPSRYRANFWRDEADMILSSDTLETGVEKLKREHVGLVIIVNKYDGIDLPKKACTVLVIDGLPDARKKIDKIKEAILSGNDIITTNKIQKIEQGMGRGIRSKDDHCVVFLMGRTLINQLYVEGAIENFSPATKQQLSLSDNLSKQLRNSTLRELFEVVNYSLKRNTNWIQSAKNSIIKTKYDPKMSFDERIVFERQAFNNALIGEYRKSAHLLSNLANSENNLSVKGYLKQLIAEYTYFYDPVEAQQILKSAIKYNSQITHPLDGIVYDKLLYGDTNQAENIAKIINEETMNINKYILKSNQIIDQLVFRPGTSNTFEQAIMELGEFIGFQGQRPENEFRKGPDNLWGVGTAKYFVIECKNGATTETINKKDCNQLNGSITWFENKYDNTNSQTPIMIHKSTKFEYAASPNSNIRIMNEDMLEKLKNNFKNFIQSLGSLYTDLGKVEELLSKYKFKENQFIHEFTLPYKVSKI